MSYEQWRNEQAPTLAADFLGLRARGIAAKPAAIQVASFHGVPEIRVLSAYELGRC